MRISARFALGLALTFIPCLTAQATDQGVVFAGGTVSDDLSGYGGAVVALPGGALGRGLALRASGNVGRYEYRAGERLIHGDFAGGEVSLVEQLSGAWGYANLGVGGRFEQTNLHPLDLTNNRRGARWDAGLTTDGGLIRNAWRLGWYGGYGPVVEDYQARLDLTRRAGSRLRLGIEGGAQGDPTYHRFGAGVLGIVRIGRATDFRLSGGGTQQPGRGARAYAALAVAQLF